MCTLRMRLSAKILADNIHIDAFIFPYLNYGILLFGGTHRTSEYGQLEQFSLSHYKKSLLLFIYFHIKSHTTPLLQN